MIVRSHAFRAQSGEPRRRERRSLAQKNAINKFGATNPDRFSFQKEQNSLIETAVLSTGFSRSNVL